MQSSERNTRSLRKLVPDQPASPGPESQTDTGQYMCIECSETFDTRLELNSHSQSHVTKKQFTCTHCGRGFHHQVFLQMHERSHEDGASAAPGKTTAGRVISTRSSKMPDVVHVKPTPTKPPCLINSIVEFKDEQKAGQAVTPKELVTRRTHGTPSVSQRRDSLEKNNLFELRISKYSDRTVTLLDSFGNSIEILADVFNTYTIGETEQNGETTKADEALANTSEASPSRNADEICSKSLSEEPSVSPQTESTEPPPPVEKGSLLTSHELVTSETITSEDLDSDLRAVQSKNAATHQQEQSRPSSETLRPEIASTDKESLQIPKEIINNQSVNSAITSDLPVYTEDHMETSPAGPTSPQHVLNESLESDQTSSKTSAGDKPGASVTSQGKYPKNSSIMEPPNKSKDPSFLDAPSFLNDSVGREESKQRSVDAEAVADLEQNPGLSLLKPEIRQDSIPPPERQDDHSSTLPESSIHKPSNKESVDPCNSLSVNRDLNPSIENKSAKERGAQNEEAAVTFPGSERLASTVSPENLQESSKKNLNLDTDALSQVSISEEINLDDGKDAAKHCSILVRQDMLHDHELVIDDKRDDDLFERDIFPLGSAMENLVCGKSHSSKMIQQKESDLCLNGSDMTYISESEMIKLLEQDKDDITDDEPITTDQRDLENIEVSPDGDESKPKPEAALSNNSKESSRSPVNWDEQHNTAVGVVPAEHSDLPANMIDTAEVQHYPIKSKAIDFTDLPSETCDLSDVPTLQTSLKEKMDTDSGLPVNKDDQCAGGNEPQDPIESMETEDLMSKNRSEEHLGLFKASSSSNVELVTKEDNPDIPQLAQGVQGGDQNDGNSLSRTERTSENVTPEVNIDTVDKFEDSKANLIESISVKDVVISLGQEKLNTSTPDDTVSIIKEQQTKIDDALPLSQKELGDAKTFPANDTETRDSICSQEGISPPQNAPLEDRDHVQSITDDQDRSNPASPGSTNLKSDGMANQQEGTDIPSVQSSELGELPTANPKLGGPEVSSNIDAEEDLEEQSSALPKANDDLESEVTKQADALTNKVSDTLPVCNDLVQGSLEDSDLVENDHQDDLDSKPLSSGGECVKCGRKLRRSRKDLAWSPVCFKCRLVAKKRDRLSNQEAAEDLDLAIESGTEKSFPEDSSKSVVEHEDELPQDLFNKPSAALDPLVAVDEKETPGSSSKKTYKCPKCDEAFRIPALLAGHIKCHTLPQCVSCGCQMRLKYKTKRIPRRCQKCFQQLKEKIKARQSVEDVSGEGSDSDEEDIENADVTELSPGKRLDEEVDSFEQDEESSKKPENESSDELDVTAQDLGSPDGENPRLCNQCGKAFKCKRSLNLHLLSHSGSQCESCGCRLAKKRRVGRWSKKCRACRLQTKDNLLDDVEDEMGASSQKAPKQKNAASLRVKAKQSAIGKNTRTQSIVKKKKELKWMNMLLAVKGLMDKSRRKKENALQAATSEKKEGEGSGTEKSDVTSADDTSADPDKSDLNESDMEKASGSGLIKDLSGTPKPGRKCLYREKNIIKVEESETYIPTSAASIFIKQEETWQCLECTQSWPNSEALVNHQRSHISGESLTCPQCPQVFSSEQYLDVHVLTHDENRPFRCPECNKTFTKRNHLGVHMRVHTGSRPYACPECPCRFRQKVTLIAHRYTHRNYQMLFTKPFQCSVCSKSFKQKERLVVHERSHTGECPFSCKDCDQVFPSKARLYVHRRMHKMCDEPSTSEQNLSGKEISEGQPFRCQDCGKVCTTKASFVLHRKVHRLSSIPIQTIKVEQQDVHPFFCRDCNKAFSTKGNLTVHLKKHSAHRGTAVANLDVKGGYPCKDCDKLCLTKASLVLHRKVHKSPSAGEPDLDIKVESDTPSYNCKYCNKVCSTKASLVLHCKVHRAELGTEKPSFKCKVCDMVFSTKASFVLHRKVHRSSSSNPQSPKTDAEPGLYSCKHCDMVCSTKASFVLHSKVHKSPSIGEENAKGDAELKLYNCKHCDMVCSTKAGFVLHNKVHRSLVSEQSPQTEEEPQLFNCKHCDMICSTKASFVLHNKVHRSSLSGEQSSKASEEPQSYSCKHCDMVCSTKASFVLHNKVHRSAGEQGTKGAEEPQSYSCKDCDMAFSTKGSLALHSKVHRSGQNLQGDAEGNPFVCKDCNKVCSTKASLVLHRKVHRSAGNELNPSGDAEDTTLPCKDCGKMFSSKRRLSIHRHKFHDVSLSNDENSDDEDAGEQAKKTNEEKPFSCPICDLRFAKLKMLVRHKAVHGERTVTPCIHCGKRFLYMKSLFNHIKVCQSKSKGKKMLKKVAVKRKILKDGGSGGTSSDGESGPKKRKADDKPKALTAAQKLKNKNMTVKAKKAGAGKGKGRSVGDPKVKEKRVKVESDDASEGEGKSDAKQEKPSEQPTTEPVAKKNATKIKKVKKEPSKEKAPKVVSGGARKWRVLAASTVKKKNLQAVLIGGKKKLLLKKKVQLKPKPGGKVGKD